MVPTQTQSRRLQRASQPVKIKERPLTRHSLPLVPETKVKEMLRDIAFVLQITRRLSSEIREPMTCTEAAHG